MEKKIKRDIAITFENFIQYQSLVAGIDFLIEKGISVDIYVPICNNDTGFGDMYNDMFAFLNSRKYRVYRKNNDDITYKILLEPYPMDSYFKFNYEYRIKYKYGLSAKPDPVYRPEWNIYYDAILVNGVYETEFFDVYAKTHIIGNLKYVNYKKSLVEEKKKVLLYLPTYGDLSSIEKVSNALLELKKDYTIITKLHHGTSFLKSEAERNNLINEYSDEIYDQHKPLIELLSKASVVLSDNSGAVFESICAEVPVCIYSQDIKKCSLGEFTPLQYDLVQDGIIPYTDKIEEIKDVVNKTMYSGYFEKQKKIRKYLFSIENDKLLDNFYNTIKKYLELEEKTKYKKLHDNLSKDYKSKVDRIIDLEAIIYEKDFSIHKYLERIRLLETENEKLKSIISENEKNIKEQDKIINIYKNGKLYKLAENTYKITNRLIKKKEDEK